jgi:GAF domain-containing protein
VSDSSRGRGLEASAAQPDVGRQSADARERLLAEVLVRLADTLADDFDVVEFLQGLSADAVRVLDADAAGVMLADGRGGLRLVASSEERMRILELFELQSEQGPCLDAFHAGAIVQVGAVEGALRWPTFAPAAAANGFPFMCGLPLQLRGTTIGALNLFRATDAPFGETDLVLAQAMAKVAAIGLLQQRSITERQLLAEQLQTALHSRVVIEQAKGMLAEYLGVTVDAAFDSLRQYARDNNLRITDLARDVACLRIGREAFSKARPRG